MVLKYINSKQRICLVNVLKGFSDDNMKKLVIDVSKNMVLLMLMIF